MICAYCGREAVGGSLSCPGCGAPPVYEYDHARLVLDGLARAKVSAATTNSEAIYAVARYGDLFQNEWDNRLSKYMQIKYAIRD